MSYDMEEIIKKEISVKEIIEKFPNGFSASTKEKIKGLSRLDKYYPNEDVNFIDSSVFSMEINPAWIHAVIWTDSVDGYDYGIYTTLKVNNVKTVSVNFNYEKDGANTHTGKWMTFTTDEDGNLVWQSDTFKVVAESIDITAVSETRVNFES